MISPSLDLPAGGSAVPDVLSVTATLLQSPWGSALRVAEFNETFAALISPSGAQHLIFNGELWPHPLEETLTRAAETVGQRGGTLIVLGGSSQRTASLQGALPLRTPAALRFLHLTSAGNYSSFPERRRLRDPLGRALRLALPLTNSQHNQALTLVQERLAGAQRDIEEQQVFQDAIAQRKPYATYGILTLIGIMFLLQSYVGTALAEKMGALTVASVKEGQWWRLVSVGFLHGGFVHAAMNSFVLYILGAQVERVLGTRRFLILYLVSLVGGSLASLSQLGEGTSVGASGAIWGILATQACFAFGKPAILPQALAQRMRAVAVQNLAINIFISFQANIDWAAHLGGGLAGAALLLSGILSPGLLSPTQALTDPSSEKSRDTSSPPWLNGAAILSVLIMVSCVLFAQFSGKSWKLAGPAILINVPLPELGLTIALPQGVKHSTKRDPETGWYVVEYGTPGRDLAFGTIQFSKGPGPSTREGQVKTLKELLSRRRPPEGTTVIVSPHLGSLLGAPASREKYRYANDVELDVLILPLPQVLLRSDLLCVQPGHAQCPTQEQILKPLL